MSVHELAPPHGFYLLSVTPDSGTWQTIPYVVGIIVFRPTKGKLVPWITPDAAVVRRRSSHGQTVLTFEPEPA
jgi:hypothetical protein